MNNIKEALTFDDVQILPKYSEIESRNDVKLVTRLSKQFYIDVPIIASPMDTVCGLTMALTLNRLGAVGAIHRFMTVSEAVSDVHELMIQTDALDPVIGTIGVTGDFHVRAERLLEAGANILLIDVAHGDHIHVKRAMEWLNNMSTRTGFDIIAGSVATAEGALRLESWGADAIRVGIGGGSMCETRIRTGIGVPQLDAIHNVAEWVDVPVIADGGIRTSGDLAKALAAGADTVMLGSILAGTDETPGDGIYLGNNRSVKRYRGSASASAKADVGMPLQYIEGASTDVDVKGPVAPVIKSLVEGLRSSMSYVGARNITEFQHRAEFVRITQSGLVEAQPHGLKTK
jgi:IMP dehydrogenase